MTLPNDRARPVRGILWAGFFFILIALCFLNGLVLPVLAATSQDDPPPTQTVSPSPTASIEVLVSTTLPPTIAPSLTPSVSSSPTEISATSPSPTPSIEPSPDSSQTPSITPSSSPDPTITTLPIPTKGVSYPSGSILIGEVAWSGTIASAHDEWIELYNPGASQIDLNGWVLTDDDDIQILLSISIAPYSFVLLERTDDSTVASIPADQIYTDSLKNSGDSLMLLDPVGGTVDSANATSGAWPAGDSSSRASIERWGGSDQPGNCTTFTGYFGVGVDAVRGPIQGTPRQVNSIFFPTPQPTWIPGKIVINEVLIRPHYDWEGLGGIDTGDEFIELINLGPLPVNLRGWALDDIEGAGSKPYTLPNKTLPSGEFVVLFRSRTHIALNDGGDNVRLLAPNGLLVDQLSYLRVRAYNLSYGRLPDSSGHLSYGL